MRECEKALMEGEWDRGYMELIRSSGSGNGQVDYFSDAVIGIVMCGSVEIKTYPICDAPPEIKIQENDYLMCLERRHSGLDYIGAFRATANTCIKL